MRVTISWRNYPNCPEATEYDKSRSYLMHFIGMFVGIALFALVIGFFVCMSSFWTDADWGQFFGGLLCLLSGGALAHMVFVWYPHCTEKGLQLIFLKYKTSSFDNFKKLEEKRIKKECNDELRETTKIYYFWFLSVVIFALIVCIFIFSIVRMAMDEGGIGWLLFSLCAAGGAVFGFLRLKSIIDGPVITPPKKTITSSNSSQSAPAATSVKTNTTSTSTELYCRKCGRKLNVLQAFCQSCGTPVSKNND